MAITTINAKGFRGDGPYEIHEDGVLRYAFDPKRPWMSIVRKGQVAEGFRHDTIAFQRFCKKIADKIGEYLRTMKYPEPEYPTLTKNEKNEQWIQLMSEVLEEWNRREESKTNDEVEEESDDDLREIVDEDNHFTILEEEYQRKTVGPKSYWSKPFELVPRPHHQRRGKNSLSKLRFDARKTHEKYQFISQEESDQMIEEYEEECRMRSSYYSYDSYDDDDYFIFRRYDSYDDDY